MLSLLRGVGALGRALHGMSACIVCAGVVGRAGGIGRAGVCGGEVGNGTLAPSMYSKSLLACRLPLESM